jgi:chemotaxis protein CheZ
MRGKMTKKSPFGQIDDVLLFLRENREGNVLITNVCALAEIMIGAQKSFFTTLDSAIYREFRELAEYIATAKKEINALQANELHQERIPSAGRQLDAIVKSTEEATNRIMEQAEAIMAADPSDPQAYQNTVNSAVMEIFEACSFQDITGQRISKVVDTLQHIESRVSRFAKAVNARDVAPPLTPEEEAKERRIREQLLHGPLLDGEGVSQSVIDELLDGADPLDVEPAMVAAEGPVEEPAAESPMAKLDAQPVADPAPAPKAEPAAAKPAPAAAPAATKSAENGDGDVNSQSDIDALFA